MRPSLRAVVPPVAVTLTLGLALVGAIGCSSAGPQQEGTAGVQEPIQNCMALGGSCGGGTSSGGYVPRCGTESNYCCYPTTKQICYGGLTCVQGICESTTTPPPALPPPSPLSSGVGWTNANGTCAAGQTSPNGCDTNAHDYGYCTLTGSEAIPAALASSNCTLGMDYGQNGTSYYPTILWACTSFTGASGYSALVGYESACVGPIDSGYTLVVNVDLSQSDGIGSNYKTDWTTDSMPGGGPCLPPHP